MRVATRDVADVGEESRRTTQPRQVRPRHSRGTADMFAGDLFRPARRCRSAPRPITSARWVCRMRFMGHFLLCMSARNSLPSSRAAPRGAVSPKHKGTPRRSAVRRENRAEKHIGVSMKQSGSHAGSGPRPRVSASCHATSMGSPVVDALVIPRQQGTVGPRRRNETTRVRFARIPAAAIFGMRS